MASNNDAISFEINPKTPSERQHKSATEKVKLTLADIGVKRQDNFVAWNCPFDECKAVKR